MSSSASGNSTGNDSHTSQTPRRTRSAVWEHYEQNLVNVDGDLKAVCKNCGIHLNSKSGTSSLRGHIANACPAISTTARQRFQLTLTKQPLAEPFVFDPELCREEMTKYIIHAEIPFLKFEDPYLEPWLKTMQPTFKVRGRQTIRDDCMRKYVEMRKELQVELQNLDSRVCLTSDIWTSSQNLGYMAVTAHYIDAEFKIKKKIIWFKELEYPHSGFAIEEELLRCLTFWGIKEKIFTLTLDNASNNTSACDLLVSDCKHDLVLGGEHLHVRCCAHIINILVQDGMKIIHSAIHRIRELLKHVDSSPSRLQVFNSIANGKGLVPKSGVYLDIPTRWNSTYKMLREAVEYRAVLNTYATKYFEVSPSEEEWTRANSICEFLKAFEELTLVVSAHRTITTHKFLPLVLCILHALKQDPSLQATPVLKELAAAMCSKFEKYWDPDKDSPQTADNPRRKTKEIAFNPALRALEVAGRPAGLSLSLSVPVYKRGTPPRHLSVPVRHAPRHLAARLHQFDLTPSVTHSPGRVSPRSQCTRDGRSARDQLGRRRGGGAPRDGPGRVRRGAARVLRVRGLARRQRQQQLPHDHGARGRAALRDRLPDAHAHGEVLQRAQHPGHHQRAPRLRARAALPQPRPPRRQAPRRRQLRLRRRRHPQRHRHTIREHHQDRAAAGELPGVPAEAGRIRRRGCGGAGREQCAGAHHPRRQRLRQQLLPGALLRPLSPVRHPRLRPLPHLRVQENPCAAVRARCPARGGDGHGDDRVRAGGAGHAQHRRRVRARPHGGGRPLQPAAGADAARTQRPDRPRRLPLRQHQPGQLRLRLQPAGLRVRDVQGGVLRAGSVQRDRAVHAGIQRVPQPGRVRVLGRVPPHGARQPDHRRPVHARLHRPHQPHEHQHHPRHGQKGLASEEACCTLQASSMIPAPALQQQLRT